MEFTFTVTCSVERAEGKFASRDELLEQLQEAIEGANPEQLEGENGGQYEVQDWEVEEQPQHRKPRSRRKTADDNGPRALRELLP